MRLPSPSEIRKALAAIAGLAALLIAQGVLSGTAEHVVEGILTALTALGVYTLPNAPPKPPTAI